jgi:hypothetical protein
MAAPKLTNAGSTVAITIVRGKAFADTLTIIENGSAANITGRTYASQIRTATGTLAATATCTIADAANGKVSVAYTAAGTSALVAGTEYVWAFVQTKSGIAEELLRGDVSVLEDITA